MAWPIGVLFLGTRRVSLRVVRGGRGGRLDVRATVGEDHYPGLEGVFRPGDGGNACAEGEAFKGFCWKFSCCLIGEGVGTVGGTDGEMQWQ